MPLDMLPIAIDDPSDELLVDAAGCPVWPVRMQSEFDLLALSARRAGSVLLPTPSSAAGHDASASAGTGTVACVEPNLAPDARLYAHLTRRRFVPVVHAAGLADIGDLDVLVCSSEMITSELLHCLYDPARPSSPGIIYGRTPAELRSRVLRGAASAALGAADGGRYVQVWPDVGAGGEAERAWVRDAVGLDASVLAVLTHSDGLDAPLVKGDGRGNLLICPIRQPLEAAPHRTPECRHSGWCHRLRMPLAQAFASGEVIEPAAFRARVLVWSTCFGALDAGAPLDRQWSLVHQFNLNPYLDLVLAKWRAAFGHGAYGALVEGLAGGRSVGTVVAAFNGVEGTRERGGQFAIFGDPRVAAPFCAIDQGMAAFYYGARNPPPALPAEAPAPVGPAAGVLEARMAQLRLSLRITLRHEDERRDAGRAAERLEHAYERMAHGHAAAALADVQAAALDCFRHYADLVRGWSPYIESQRFALGAPCAHCGERKSEAVNVCGMGWRPRRIGACPRCQIAEDAPSDYALGLRVTANHHAELVGPLPPGRFAGIVNVWSTTPAEGAVLRWPVDAAGAPVRRMPLAVDWPRSTARVTLWMMFDLDYATLNHRVMGAEPAALH